MSILPEAPTSAPCIHPVTEEMCALALEALMLATQKNIELLQEAEQRLLDARQQRIGKLRSLRRQKKRAALFLRRKNGSIAPEVREIVNEYRAQRNEIQNEINGYLQKINEFRGLFSQQIEDAISFGFTELSKRWAEKFLSLDTPFEEDVSTAPEGVRRPYTKERRTIASAWRNIRIAIRKAIEGGEKVAPAFAHHMKRFETEAQHTFLLPRPTSP